MIEKVRDENSQLRSKLEHTQKEFAKMRAAFDEGMKIKDQYEQLIAALMSQDAETRSKVLSVMQEISNSEENMLTKNTASARDRKQRNCSSATKQPQSQREIAKPQSAKRRKITKLPT